jgi:hypothetical protein
MDLPANQTHEFSLSEDVNPEALHDISLLHNFRGDFGFSCALNDSRNINGSQDVDVVRPTERWSVLNLLRFDGEMYVKCPTGRPLVTSEERRSAAAPHSAVR